MRDVDREFKHPSPQRAEVHGIVQELSSRYDLEYFSAAERAGPGDDEVLRLFRRARAHAALGFLLLEDPSLHEAVYEAIAARSDRAAAIQSCLDMLS